MKIVFLCEILGLLDRPTQKGEKMKDTWFFNAETGEYESPYDYPELDVPFNHDDYVNEDEYSEPSHNMEVVDGFLVVG